MKKVIEGRLYNTETAKKLDYWDSEEKGINGVHEELYRTKSGAYFIYGEGGPNTRYAERLDSNSWTSGEKIIPLTAQAAREWAEKYLDAEEYSQIFGEPEEASDAKDILNISISSELKRNLIRMREETGKSISQIIEEKFSSAPEDL